MHSDFGLFPCLSREESKSEKLIFDLMERGFQTINRKQLLSYLCACECWV